MRGWGSVNFAIPSPPLYIYVHFLTISRKTFASITTSHLFLSLLQNTRSAFSSHLYSVSKPSFLLFTSMVYSFSSSFTTTSPFLNFVDPERGDSHRVEPPLPEKFLDFVLAHIALTSLRPAHFYHSFSIPQALSL